MAQSSVKAPKKRISKSTRISMMGLSLFLDLAPVLIFFVAVGLAFIAATQVASTAQHTSKQLCEYTGYAGDAWGLIVHNPGAIIINNTANWLGNDYRMAYWSCESQSQGVGTVALGATALLGLWGSATIYPIMAAVTAAMAGILYAGIFTVWFGVKGINMWGLTPRRILGNFTTFVGESIPLISLLPFMTINTALHIRAADAEDRVRKAEHARKVGAAIKKQGRRAQRRIDRAVKQETTRRSAVSRRRRRRIQQDVQRARQQQTRVQPNYGATARQRTQTQNVGRAANDPIYHNEPVQAAA